MQTPATVRAPKAKKPPTATELAIKEVNGIVGSFDTVAAGLDDLSTKYLNVVYPVTTTKGMEEAKAARMEIREARFKVQRALDAAKSPLNTLKADITARANEIIGQITPLEDPIDAQIKAEEQRKADEKAAREKAEADAKARIDAQIDAIRGFVVNCTGMSSADIEEARVGVEGIIVDLETFGDRTGEAEQVKARVLESLASMRDAAKVTEDQRAELARQQEELRAQREADEAERVRKQAEETKRLADERAANEKAAKELADQRAAFQKEQDEARAEQQAREDAERKRKQEAEDKERAEKRAAEEALDAKRKGWRGHIDAMKGLGVLRHGTVAEVDASIAAVGNVSLSEENFGEYLEEANEVHRETLAALATRRAEAVEAEEARLRHQRLGEEREAREAADLKVRDAAPVMLKALQAAHHMLTRDPIDDAKMAVVTQVSEAIELAGHPTF